MKRKEFLKSIGLASAGMMISTNETIPNNQLAEENGDCAIIPTEVAGPFPLDLSTNNFYLRQNIIEDREGKQLNLKMKIIGSENCYPMRNVRVNIWHCDKDGNYSGYGNQTGQTYLRGYQMTDANGEVEFITIFPGWYPGRVCHIHFQVYVSASYAAISQFTFDHDAVNNVYKFNSSIYTRGEDPQMPETDGAFSDGYNLQLASLEPNSGTGGYDALLSVTVQGEGTVGVSHIERQTSRHLIMEQNFPNPFLNETRIPFKLKFASKVKFELWGIEGKRILEIDKGRLSAGDHEIVINLKSLELLPANYLYQIEIENNSGQFKTCKLMTHYK